jgi:hypothetical protein
MAVASLVLGIFGLVGCPLVASIVAVILGTQARTKIRQDPSLEGDGLARVGVILGWIGIDIAALLIVGGIIALVSFRTTGYSGPFRDALGLLF